MKRIQQQITNNTSKQTQSSVTPYVIVDMKPNHFSSICKIANQQLGQNYVTTSFLTYCYEQSNDYINRVAIDKKTLSVVGFCISIQVESSDLEDLLQIDQSKMPSFFLESNDLGVIKTIAVHQNYSGLGIGTHLIKDALQLLAIKKRSHVFTIAWKSELGINLHGVLMKTGFKRFIEIPHYWYQSSLESGCHCSVCGKPPCSCSAVIYGIHIQTK